MVVHASNPGPRRLRQEDGEFKPSLGCISRPLLKKQTKTNSGRWTPRCTKLAGQLDEF
jgi:hypothetical protein